ncbi:hypothetical protein [Streptomyces sp. NPDC127084]|uniref:hypothetical protein n=1 Tax=Streptomyces sp. NPDC127084 TaxID=3347133 RepID=UPI003649C879
MTDTRIVLDDDTRQLLGKVADRLGGSQPEAPMHAASRLYEALLCSQEKHGLTDAAFAAEQLLLAAAPQVRPGQTRGEYATLLRLVAEGVHP